MKRCFHWVFLLLVLSGKISFAESKAIPKPMGIGLETYEYPFPVKFLPLEVEGESVRMAYMDVNSSGRRAIVLFHGKNFFGSYWKDTIKVLSEAGFRVIVPDQIGFGKSSKPDIAYSFDLLAENTAKLLDTLKVSEAALVGHSMGGMLAVRFARNFRGRTTQLILENPIGLEDYRFKVPPKSLQMWYEKELKDTDPAKIREFFKRYVFDWKPEVFDTYADVRIAVTLSGEYPRWAKASADTYAMIYQQPVRHEFPLIKAPTLLVIGVDDRTTLGRGEVSEEVLETLGRYSELGKAAARDIPNATLVELKKVKHIPHLEAPEKFHEAVLKFLGSSN